MAANNNTSNQFSQQDVDRSEQMTLQARSLTEELKDQLGIRSRLNETEKAQLNLARQIQRSAQENTVETGNQGNITRQLTKDLKLLLKVENERVALEKQTTAAQQKGAKLIYRTQSRIEQIQNDLLNSSGQQRTSLEGQLNSAEGILQSILKIADADTQRLALTYGMESTQQALIGQRQKEEQIQKRINDKMGVTGALVKGTGALMERLGMRSGIFQDAMKDSAEVMREMAEESTRIVETVDEHGNIVRGTLKNYGKLEIMLTGFSKLASGFGKALLDPLTITTAIVSKVLELNTASVKLQRLTGQVRDLQAGHNNRLATGAQVLGVMAEMTERTGIAASAMFSSEDLGRLAEAKNLLGLSSEQASNLGMLSKVSGASIQGYKEELIASVNEFNTMNDSAVAHGVVLQDVLDASADVSMSLGGNAPKIAAASAAARKLGINLTKVNQIADGLLDFESSIESELEAQLLTGKNINLNKARELALNNDLEGVANELAKNGASAAEFAKMNRIQQEGMAKALGMSREEMGKMLINQEGQKNLSKEQKAAMRGVTLEQLEQMEASESLQLAFSKIAEPLASILSSLTPIVTMIAKAVAFIAPIGSYVMVGVLAFKNLATATQLATIKTGLLNTQTKIGNALTLAGNTVRGAAISLWNAESVAKFRNAAATKAATLAEHLMNAARKVGIILQNTTAGRWVIERAQIVASTVAKWANIGATSAQAAANATLAGTQSTVAATAIPAAGGLSAMGIALGAFGTGGAAAIPVLLSIAAVIASIGLAALGLGYGFKMAADGLVNILTNVSMEKIKPLFLIGGALMSIAAGLSMISVAGLAAIPALAALSGFALMATPLIALGGLFGDGGEDNGGFAKLEAKLDTLIEVISSGGDVYLDSDKVGRTQAKSFSRLTGS